MATRRPRREVCGRIEEEVVKAKVVDAITLVTIPG